MPVNRIQLTLPRATVRYLHDIMRQGIYGTTKPAVVNYLILRGIEELVSKRMLSPRHGPAARGERAPEKLEG